MFRLITSFTVLWFSLSAVGDNPPVAAHGAPPQNLAATAVSPTAPATKKVVFKTSAGKRVEFLLGFLGESDTHDSLLLSADGRGGPQTEIVLDKTGRIVAYKNLGKRTYTVGTQTEVSTRDFDAWKARHFPPYAKVKKQTPAALMTKLVSVNENLVTLEKVGLELAPFAELPKPPAPPKPISAAEKLNQERRKAESIMAKIREEKKTKELLKVHAFPSNSVGFNPFVFSPN